MLDAGRTGEVNGGVSATANGSLAGAVSIGADELGGFSLDSSAAAINTLTTQNLTSNGVALTYTVSGSTLTAMAGATEVFTLSLSGTNNSSYTFTLKSHLDHPTLDLVAGDNTENQMSINFGGLVKVTDRDGDSVNLPAGNFSIRVQDDIPVAANITKSIAATVHAVTNLTLILDVSGSMSATVNVGGVSMSRYEAERQAAKTLIDAYEALGDVKVNIVTFSSAATKVGGYWIDSVAAKAAIDALPAAPGGNTNYDAPITMAQLGYNTTNMGGLLGNAKDALYFMSDGVPNEPSGSVGMSTTEEAAWRTFLQGTNAAGQQITAYALGMGPDVTATTLNPVAFDGTGTTGNVGGVVGNTDAIIVSDFGQLTQTLLSTIAIPSVSGNLLTDPNPDVGFGADGGHVQSFTVNGVTYTINSALSSVTTTGTATTGTNTFAFDDANNVITVTVGSATGAKIAIDMDSGAYTYTAAPGQLVSKIENIGFTFTDRDGDSASANLRINVDIPALVVGKNASDVVGSNAVHQVNPVANTAGRIAGEGANDVLIGDVGGSVSGTYNLTLILDVSGSVNATEFTLMKDAVKGLLDKYAGASELHVDMGIFATGIHNYGTIGDTTTAANLTTAQAITAAKAAIDAINRNSTSPTGQNTNYQLALEMANTMVTGDPAANHKQVFFLTDGDPTTGNVMTTADITAKMLTLTNLTAAGIEINAVGIGLGDTSGTDTSASRLNEIDNTANGYIAVSSFADLAAGLGAIFVPVALGADSVVGGDGNDAILGDSIFSTSADKGWTDYVATHPGLTAEQMRADIHGNLTTGSRSYAQEGTVGANDTLDGGAGNDVIYGQGGNDLIIGGKGNDILSGGTGADTLKWNAGDQGVAGTPAVDVIRDFNPTNTAANKDVLDLRDLLTGETHTAGNSGNMANFLTFSQSGADVTLSIKSSGAGTADQIITLQGVTMQQLGGANSTDSAGVISSLLANNKLITD